MGKMWMPTQGFKKVHEDNQKAVLQHPDGHQVMLAKAMMSPHLQAQLSALPLAPKPGMARGGRVRKMDDGGDAGDGSPPQIPPQMMPQIQTPPEAQQQVPVNANPQDLIRQSLEAQAKQAQAQQQQPGPPQGASGQWQPPQQGQQQGQPQPGPSNMNIQGQGQGQSQPGAPAGGGNDMYRQIYQNQAAMYQKQAMAYQQAAAHQQQVAGTIMKLNNHMMDDYTAFKKDVLTNKVDPNHYFTSMGTAGKISTAIGAILGGIGGGLTRQGGNVAMDFINKQIENDVNAQVQNMGTKVNLMKVNMEMTGSMQHAMEMTAAQEQGIVAAKIQQMAAQQQSQQASMFAKAFSQQFDNEAARKIAGVAQAQVLGYKPDQIIPGGPTGVQGYALGSGQDARDQMQNLDQFQQALNDYKSHVSQNWGILTNAGKGWGAVSAQNDRLRNSLAEQKNNALYGRNKWSKDQLDDTLKGIPSPGQLRQKQVQDFIAGTQNEINQKRNAVLGGQTLGFNPTPMTKPMGVPDGYAGSGQ